MEQDVSDVNVVFAAGVILAGAVVLSGLLLMVVGITLLAAASIRRASEAVASGLIDASFALCFGGLGAGIAWALAWALVLLSRDLFRDVIA
jgi:hypothetical protein